MASWKRSERPCVAGRTFFNQLEQRGGCNRLRAVSIETCAQGGSNVGNLSVSRQRDEPHGCVRLAQMTRELVAIHVRQADVQDGDFRLEIRRHSERI